MLSFKVLNSLRSLHIEAIDWHNRVVSNGGSVSPTTLRAVSNFCRSIDGAGIRSKFLRLNLFCGNNLNSCLTPLYRGPSYGALYGNTTETNVGPFIDTDFTESVGLTGNGSSKLLETGLTIGTLATLGANYNNVHVSVYQRGVVGGDPVFGGQDIFAPVYGNSLILDTAGSLAAAPSFFDAGGANVDEGVEMITSATVQPGFNLAQSYEIPGPVDAIWLTNGTANSLSSSISVFPFAFNSLDPLPLYVMGAYNNDIGDGSPNPLYSVATLAGYSVGLGIDSVNSGDGPSNLAFYKAMLAFQTALRRNV
jgi:hypothetical protein